jgi:hypothetical protein
LPLISTRGACGSAGTRTTRATWPTGRLLVAAIDCSDQHKVNSQRQLPTLPRACGGRASCNQLQFGCARPYDARGPAESRRNCVPAVVQTPRNAGSAMSCDSDFAILRDHCEISPVNWTQAWAEQEDWAAFTPHLSALPPGADALPERRHTRYRVAPAQLASALRRGSALVERTWWPRSRLSPGGAGTRGDRLRRSGSAGRHGRSEDGLT